MTCFTPVCYCMRVLVECVHWLVVCVCVSVRVCVSVCVCVSVNACECVCLCPNVCMCVNVFVSTGLIRLLIFSPLHEIIA